MEPSAEVRERLDEQVHRMLPVVALVSGVVYLLSATLMRGMWPAYDRLFTSVYAVAGFAFLGLAAFARAGRVPVARGQDAMFGVLAVGAGSIALNVIAPDGIHQVLGAMICLLAAGILLLSWPRFIAVATLQLAAGSAVGFVALGVAGTMPSVLLLACALVAAMLHHSRLQSTLRTERLLIENAQQRAQLEAALAELRRSQEQAVHREKLSALGTLVAGVAHEINNPLAYMRGNVELCAESLQDARAGARSLTLDEAEGIRASLDEVARGIDRIAHITKSLKNVARPAGGTFEEHDINAIVDEVLTVASSRTGPDIVTVRDLADHARCRVNASEVGQVLLNLVLNASDAMQGRGTLRVATREDGQHVVIDVDDTGPGISAAVRARLFTPFYTTKPKGTGLGLSIAHRIVENHRGEIAVLDAPRGGARFRVRLPKDPSGPRRADARSAATQPS